MDRRVLRSARSTARARDAAGRLDHLPRAVRAAFSGPDRVVAKQDADELAVGGRDGRALAAVLGHVVGDLFDGNVRAIGARTRPHRVLDGAVRVTAKLFGSKKSED